MCLQPIGGGPLSSIDNYGPYVPYSASFGTGYPKDESAVLYWLSTGGAGIGLSAAKLKVTA